MSVDPTQFMHYMPYYTVRPDIAFWIWTKAIEIEACCLNEHGSEVPAPSDEEAHLFHVKLIHESGTRYIGATRPTRDEAEEWVNEERAKHPELPEPQPLSQP